MKNHFATIINLSGTIKIYYKNEFFAESNNVKELNEHYKGKDLIPVLYFPKNIFSEILIRKEENTSYCPIKGTASYWSYEDASNSIWSYENPLESVSLIRGYYSFYENKGFKIIRN